MRLVLLDRCRSHSQQLPPGLRVMPIFVHPWKIFNRLLKGPEREDIRNGVATLVCRTKNGVRGTWSAFSVRDRREALQTMEENVETGADVNFCRASLGVECVDDAQRWFHGTASDTRLERHGRDIENSSTSRLRSGSSGGGHCTANVKMLLRVSGSMMRTGDERSQLLRDRLTFAHRRIDEVEEVRIAVDGEPIRALSIKADELDHAGTYKFAAFAVSMTLPPPTARKWLKSCSLAHAMASRQLSSVGSVTTRS